MKILHVTEAFGGGVFTSVGQLVAGQVAAGHEVILAVSTRAETPDNWRELIPGQVKVIDLVLRRAISPKNDFKGVLQLKRMLRDLQPDVVHLHSSKAGFAGRVASFLSGFGAKTFYSPRGFAFLAPGLSGRKRAIYYALEKVGAWFGGTLVACSGDELAEARNMRLASKVAHINNAIDLSKLRTQLGATSKKSAPQIRVYTAGRVCEGKRPELFVAVAEEIKRRALPATFTWVGGGDEFPATSAATCTGWMPREKVMQELQANADIFLQTSSYEGLSLAILEAQSLGLPAVVTNVVGNRSAVEHEVTGFVCDATVQALADSVERLVTDENLRVRMSAAAQSRAEAEFDTPLMLRRYESLYRHGHV